jgi:hypothetical protein
MFSSKDFEKVCTPAKLYFALAILSILLGLFSGFHFMAILMKLIFAVIYTFILSWLCKKGFTGLSWFLVLLPYVLILLMMFGVLKVAKKGMNMTMNSMNPMNPMNSGSFLMFPLSNSPQQQALNAG